METHPRIRFQPLRSGSSSALNQNIDEIALKELKQTTDTVLTELSQRGVAVPRITPADRITQSGLLSFLVQQDGKEMSTVGARIQETLSRLTTANGLNKRGILKMLFAALSSVTGKELMQTNVIQANLPLLTQLTKLATPIPAGSIPPMDRVLWASSMKQGSSADVLVQYLDVYGVNRPDLAPSDAPSTFAIAKVMIRTVSVVDSLRLLIDAPGKIFWLWVQALYPGVFTSVYE